MFEYTYCTDDCLHCIYHRSALHNGRHVVDVLRAVCGPADVCGAELDRVRRKATETAMNMWRVWWFKREWKGVGGPSGWGGAVNAQEKSVVTWSSHLHWTVKVHFLLDNCDLVNHHFVLAQRRILVNNAKSSYKQTQVGRRVWENHDYLWSPHLAFFSNQCIFNFISWS